MRVAPLALVGALTSCSFAPPGTNVGDGDGPVAIDAGDAAVPIDAAAIDAPLSIDAPPLPIDAGFDPTMCPTNYDLAIGASRYRIRNTSATYAQHFAACADDTPEGFTHMIVLSDLIEATAVRTDFRVCNIGGCDSFWTGIYAIDGSAFVTTTGEAVYATWDTGQPADFDEPPVGVTYNPFARTHTDSSIDPGPTTIRTLCECDGRPSTPLPVSASALAPPSTD